MKLELKDKQVLVLGLGDTGLSALRWLKSQGAQLSVADTRDAPANVALVQDEMPGTTIYLGAFNHATFAAAELIVISPGVPLAEPQVQAAISRGISVVGDVELFAQYRPATAKIIAITGSNGKSTVTTLVGEMCQAAGLKTVVAGNIGLPVLDTLVPDFMGGETPDVYVLELSSFQLETTSSLQADAATVLNICDDHLDRYADLKAYADAKARIFIDAKTQVLNRQDSWSLAMAEIEINQITFGTDVPNTASDLGLIQEDGQAWLALGGNKLIGTSEMRIAGLHNAANALAALALCRAIDLDTAPLLNALREFKGLPHRVQWVAELLGVAFYDDSKGTNVGATCAALAGLPQKVVLIAGGDGKGQDFSPLQSPVGQNARAVVLIGRDATQIESVLRNSAVPLIHADSLEEAVQKAFEVAQSGDAVLLSPACASFDMFRNYEHRAEVFVGAVNALVGRVVRGSA
ncbi:MAG TPA: UDP-N-acetylmuramoyl-L-alanine--D-glutamate ligase [Methylophilaceae bacterium]|nr:UDP-N-acetylmuramoyl-L-alanine--D-glutamate ligase [Methylophilaceae bacterium]